MDNDSVFVILLRVANQGVWTVERIRVLVASLIQLRFHRLAAMLPICHSLLLGAPDRHERQVVFGHSSLREVMQLVPA